MIVLGTVSNGVIGLLSVCNSSSIWGWLLTPELALILWLGRLSPRLRGPWGFFVSLWGLRGGVCLGPGWSYMMFM